MSSPIVFMVDSPSSRDDHEFLELQPNGLNSLYIIKLVLAIIFSELIFITRFLGFPNSSIYLGPDLVQSPKIDHGLKIFIAYSPREHLLQLK